ncbi:MAG: hypothetical protein IT565_10395 [Rhodospirillales bacterium]|nr:hypothetical protein [Rhodospirillales bacterium]MCC7167969.1 hypothetical protein [Rhodospirillales bacterium]
MMRQRFEIAIYNSEVRHLVAQGEHHRQLPDSWSETHYVEVEANSAEDACARLQVKYPAEKGYVVEGVTPVRADS